MRLVLLLTALAAFAQNSPSVVEGTVVDAITKAPLANVAVAVRYTRPPDGSGIMTGMTAQGAVTLTGEDGKFRIEESRPVPFRLYCQLEGYVPKHDNLVYDLKPGAAGPRATIALDPESQIAGRVTDAETRTPVAGVVVGVFRDFAVPVKSEKTDAGGRYVVKGLAAGEYQLRLHASGQPQARPAPSAPPRADQIYPEQWYPGVDEPSGALPVKLAAGVQLDGHDFRIRKRPSYPVRGVVEIADGSGAIAFTLSTNLPHGRFHQSIGVIDKPGPFEIRSVPPGPHLLQVNSTGTAPDQRRYASAFIEVIDKPVTGILLSLLPGVPVSGEFRSFQLRDAKNDPLLESLRAKPLRFALMPTRRGMFQSEGPRPCGPDGKFSLPSVSLEPWSLYVTDLPPGFVVRAMHYNGSEVSPVYFELNPAAMTHHLTVFLGQVANSISGRVTRAEAPAEGALVVAVLENSLGPDRRLKSEYAKVGADGRYSLGPISPGFYRILVLPDPMASLGLLRRLSAGEGVRLEIGESANVTRDFELK